MTIHVRSQCSLVKIFIVLHKGCLSIIDKGGTLAYSKVFHSYNGRNIPIIISLSWLVFPERYYLLGYIESNLHATLTLDQLTKRWLTEALIEEKISDFPIHRFCKMDTIPADKFAWIITFNGSRWATRRMQVEVQWSSYSSTARFESFLKLVLF